MRITGNQLSTAIFALLILVAGAVIGAIAWPMFTTSAESTDAKDGDDDHDQENRGAVLSEAALRSMGVATQPLEARNYRLMQDLPGIVAETDRSRAAVTTHLGGIVEELFVWQGEAVQPGTPVARLRLTDERVLSILQELVSLEAEADVVRLQQDTAVHERTAELESALQDLRQERDRIAMELAFTDGDDRPSLAGETYAEIVGTRRELAALHAEQRTVTAEQERLASAGEAVARGESIALANRARELSEVETAMTQQLAALQQQLASERALLEARQEQIADRITLLREQQTAAMSALSGDLDAIALRRRALMRQLDLLGLQPDDIAQVLSEEDGDEFPQPRLTVVAPRESQSGRAFLVEDLTATVGEYVDAGGVLLHLSDPWVLWVRAEVTESELTALARGMGEATAQAFFPGDDHGVDLRLIRIEHHVGEESRLGVMLFELINDITRTVAVGTDASRTFLEVEHRPGARVRVAVPTREYRDVIAVPHAALVSVGGEELVYLQHGEAFEAVAVVPVARDAWHAVIPIDPILAMLGDHGHEDEHADHAGDEDDHEDHAGDDHGEDEPEGDAWDDSWPELLEGEDDHDDHAGHDDDEGDHEEHAEVEGAAVVIHGAYRLHLALQQLAGEDGGGGSDPHAGHMH